MAAFDFRAKNKFPSSQPVDLQSRRARNTSVIFLETGVTRWLKHCFRHGSERRLDMSVAIGLVADSKAWKHAIVVLQMLRDVQTSLPAVVFNTTALVKSIVAAISAMQATVVSLEPEMPLHNPMLSPLSRAHGKVSAWRKLALWAQLTYSKIIYLDIDVLVMRNIDHVRDPEIEDEAIASCPSNTD